MFLHHAISWFVALIGESPIIRLGSFSLVAGWGQAGSGPAQRKKQKFVSTALLTTHTRAFIHRKIGFLFNINRSTNGSLCFFAVLKQGSYLRFLPNLAFYCGRWKGSLFLRSEAPSLPGFQGLPCNMGFKDEFLESEVFVGLCGWKGAPSNEK